MSDVGDTLHPASRYNVLADPFTSGEIEPGVNGNIVGDGPWQARDPAEILDPQLQDNGGPTLTHALAPASVAIDAGDALFQPQGNNQFDQRGATFARISGQVVDIGAYESGSEFSNDLVDRLLFYNNSGFDFFNPAISFRDHDAVATDKRALLPDGSLADSSNISSYSRGINGIMIDLAGSHPNITAADFTFRVGTSNNPGSWALAPAPQAVVVLPAQGLGGADRVAINWADGAIKNTYLQVVVAANANTGLASPDEFYFGNRVGDTFQHTPSAAFVTTVADEIAVRNTPPASGQPVTSALDFDKNGGINVNDQIIARNNLGVLPRIQIGLPAAVALALVADGEGDVFEVSLGGREAIAVGLTGPRVEVADAFWVQPAVVVPVWAPSSSREVERVWAAHEWAVEQDDDRSLTDDDADDLTRVLLIDEAR